MKMKVRITFAVLVIAISFATAVQAQRGFGRQIDPEKRADQMTTMLSEKLTLNESQQAELKKINQDFIEKMQASQEKGNWEDMKALRDEHHAAISNILTAEQKETFDTHQPQWQGKRGGHGQFHKQNMEKSKTMLEEKQTYRKENILPVVVEQRAKLESEISANDKKEIAALREKLEATRKERMDNKGQLKEDCPGCGFHGKGFRGGRHGKGRGPGQGQGFGLMDESTRKQAENLVQTYSADIDKLFQEISTQREQWQKDMKAISENYKKDAVGFQHMRNRQGKQATEEMAARREFHRKLRFLLMKTDVDAQSAIPLNERKVNVYPNPATTTQFIEFEVANKGLVNVEIVDQRGNVVKSVYKGELPKGLNKLEVNVGELKGNIYYYRITDAKGVSSKAFIK